MTYVINLDSRPDRWSSIQSHLRGLGLSPVRWAAVSPEEIVAGEWSERYPVADPERRIAILRSFRSLLLHLKDTAEDEWLILQDDIRFTKDPTRKSDSLIHLYGGYTLTKGNGEEYVADPTRVTHVCPRAFRLRRPLLDGLVEAWSNETVQSCYSWTPLLAPESTSFDDPPTLGGEAV